MHRDQGPVSVTSCNFPGFFWVSQIPLYLEKGVFLIHETPQSFCFCMVIFKTLMLNTNLIKPSGLQCHKVLYGFEKISGLLRNMDWSYLVYFFKCRFFHIQYTFLLFIDFCSK